MAPLPGSPIYCHACGPDLSGPVQVRPLRAPLGGAGMDQRDLLGLPPGREGHGPARRGDEAEKGSLMAQKNLQRERSTVSRGTKVPCEGCGREIEQRGPWRRRFCNAACRGQAWRQAQVMEAALKLLKRAQAALAREMIKADE